MQQVMASKNQKVEKLAELKAELTDVRAAIKAILSGKKQSYGIGTRNATAYNMNIGELRTYRKELEQEIADLEADIAGRVRRGAIKFVPRY